MIHLLEGGRYAESTESHALPGVTAEALSGLIRESRELARIDWVRRVREWGRRITGADGAGS